MNTPAPSASAGMPHVAPAWRRMLPWAALVALLLVAQSLLVMLTYDYEATRAQEQTEQVAAGVADEIRQVVAADLQALHALLSDHAALPHWQQRAGELLRRREHVARLERRDADLRIVQALDTPFHVPLFKRIPREEMEQDAELACASALRRGSPAYSLSYFVPLPGGMGYEVVDVCLPVMSAGELGGYIIATVSLPQLLETAARGDVLNTHELSLVEADSTRLARAGHVRGSGVYVAQRLIDIGQPLELRLDSAAGSPPLIPNLAVALVLGLSLALGAVVLLLVRDVRRRAAAENALAEALSFRKAMENSLVTGLRARALDGRVTYVNPAFCQMVGFSAEELVGSAVPPYWPPEKVDAYRARQSVRLSQPSRDATAARRLRERVHAQERRTFRGADLRGAAGRRQRPPHRLDERGARRERAAPHRGARAPAAGTPAGDGASGDGGRDGLAAQPRAEPAAGGDRQLRRGLAEPDARPPGRRRRAGPARTRRPCVSPSRPNAPGASSRACTTSCADASRPASRCAASCWSRRCCHWCACRHARVAPASRSTCRAACRGWCATAR